MSPRRLLKALAVTLNKVRIYESFQEKRITWLACYGIDPVVLSSTDCMGEGGSSPAAVL